MVTRRHIATQHARTRIFILALYFVLRSNMTDGTTSTVLFVAGIAFILLFILSGGE